MSILVIDIGNTKTKFAIIKNLETIKKEIIFVDSKPFIKEKDLFYIKKQFLDKSIYSDVIISSVVPKNNDILLNFFTKELYITPKFINYNYNFLVKIKRKNIGIDIICKTEYLVNKKIEAIIIDIGTATVINYVDSRGNMNKVAITIGFNSIYKGLNILASQIPIYNPQRAKKLLNNNTEQAIHGATYFGYVALLNELANRAIKETGCINIYLTGGYSFLFKNVVQFKHFYDPHMLLKGAYVIYNRNKNLFNNIM